MLRKYWLVFFSVLLVLSIVVSGLAFRGVSHAQTPIQHIVIIVKENHTFDNYFGAYTCPDGTNCVNGTQTGQVRVKGKAQTIPLNVFQDTPPDYSHGWGNAQKAEDGGAMDLFNQGPCSTATYTCYQEAQRSNISDYWAYADNFVLDDNAWSSLSGPSFPNHMYTVAGASGPDIPHSAIANPVNAGSKWGCDAPSGATVKLYNGTNQYPCYSGITTLPDELNQAGISWTYYAPQVGQAGYIWNTLDSFQQDDPSSSVWQAHDKPTAQFLTDVASNNLPQVSWLIAPAPQSEHPGTNGNVYSMCQGEDWTVQQINAIMQSPIWSSTAIFVTWDDWGGYYDHIAPTQVDALGYGFRVPALIISPYAHVDGNPSEPTIDHTQIELSSTLKLIEEVFNVPSLGRRDASSGDLLSAFDFSVTPKAPLILTPQTCTSAIKIVNPNPTFDD